MKTTDKSKKEIGPAEHTAGPWTLQGPKISEVAEGQTYWTIQPDPHKADPHKVGKDWIVGFFYPASVLPKSVSEANIALMAKAPQMAKELAEAKAIIKVLSEQLEGVRKALYLQEQNAEMFSKVGADFLAKNPA